MGLFTWRTNMQLLKMSCMCLYWPDRDRWLHAKSKLQDNVPARTISFLKRGWGGGGGAVRPCMYICMSVKNHTDNLCQAVNIGCLRGKFRWCVDSVHFLLYVTQYCNGFFFVFFSRLPRVFVLSYCSLCIVQLLFDKSSIFNLIFLVLFNFPIVLYCCSFSFLSLLGHCAFLWKHFQKSE